MIGIFSALPAPTFSLGLALRYLPAVSLPTFSTNCIITETTCVPISKINGLIILYNFINSGPYELYPNSETLTEVKQFQNEDNKIKAIAWVKKNLSSGKSDKLREAWKDFVAKTPITSRNAKDIMDEMSGYRKRNEKVPAELQAKYDKIVDESELGNDASKHLQSFLGSSFEYDEIVKPYNITGRWKKTMFAWLISVFAESNSKEEFTNTVSEFITAGQTFTDRLPQGELFAGAEDFTEAVSYSSCIPESL